MTYKVELSLEFETQQEADKLFYSASQFISGAVDSAVSSIAESLSKNVSGHLDKIKSTEQELVTYESQSRKLLTQSESISSVVKALIAELKSLETKAGSILDSVKAKAIDCQKLSDSLQTIYTKSEQLSQSILPIKMSIQSDAQAAQLMAETFLTSVPILSRGSALLLQETPDPAYQGHKFTELDHWQFIRKPVQGG